jgi:HlyD family secretion protein
MTRTTLMVVGTLTLAISVWAFASAQPGGSSHEPSPAAPPSVGAIAAPGRIEAVSEEINLGFEIPGRLDVVLVDEGDVVRAGQVVARLDASVQRAARASAVARLAMAEAERDRVVNGARVEERREADAVRAQAEAALAQAIREVARRRNLFRDGVIAREESERAERDVTLAQARLDEATERARTVQADARPDDRARADAAVALARAQVAEVDAQLAKTELRAPSDGVIVRRYRRAGETLSFERRETLIATMADPSRLRVRVDVNETEIARLALGQSVEVTAEAYGDRRFLGTVSRISTALGQKNVSTDVPGERKDTKVLEVIVDLEPGTTLPLGLRVDAVIRGN